MVVVEPATTSSTSVASTAAIRHMRDGRGGRQTRTDVGRAEAERSEPWLEAAAG